MEGWQDHRCKRYRVTPAGNRGYGLVCCTGLTGWRDLGARVEGDRWIWSCPECRGWLRRDLWTPPFDMPAPMPSSQALESPVWYQPALGALEREPEPVWTEPVGL